MRPRDVPGASSRADDVTPTVAAESFGDSLERFARERVYVRAFFLDVAAGKKKRAAPEPAPPEGPKGP